MGRRKLSLNRNGEPVVALDCDLPYNDCPTLQKVIKLNEMHLIDLASVQTEIECSVAGVIERIACLSAELNGTEIHPNIIRAIRNKETRGDTEGPQASAGRPSLIVKANPEKPLTLIISQRGRQQSQTSHPIVDSAVTSISRLKTPLQGASGRRSSRSAENAPSSPDTGPAPSSYAIPNKFWELMEPYCAEITESNITYLEELLRSYQDMDPAYFELPSLRPNEVYKSEASVSPVAKRTRRDAHVAPPTGDPTTNSAAARTCLSDKTKSNLAKCIELELRKPTSDSSSIGKLSQSLLSSCYQENVIFSFTDSWTQLTNEPSHSASNQKEAHCAVEDSTGMQHHHSESSGTLSRHDLSLDAGGHHPNPFPMTISSRIGSLVTSRASQPLKNIAKQFHVNSSFRVEKKISQVMDELGLFPLNLVHSPHHSSLAEVGTDIGQNLTNKTSSSTEVYYANLLSSIGCSTNQPTLVQRRTTDEDTADSSSAALASPLRLTSCCTPVPVCKSPTQSTVRSPVQRGRRRRSRTLGVEEECIQAKDHLPGDHEEPITPTRTKYPNHQLVNGGTNSEITNIATAVKSDRRADRLKRLRKLKLSGVYKKRRRRNGRHVSRNYQNGYTKVASEASKNPSGELPLINGNLVTDDETSRETCIISREENDSSRNSRCPLAQSPTPYPGSSIFERARNRFHQAGTSPTSSPVAVDTARRCRSGHTHDAASYSQSSPANQPCPTVDSEDRKNSASLLSPVVNGRAVDDEGDDVSDDYDDECDREEEVSKEEEDECSSDYLYDVAPGQEVDVESSCGEPSVPQTSHSERHDIKTVSVNQFFPDCVVVDSSERQPKDLLSGCTSPDHVTSCTSNQLEQSAGDCPTDEISLAILQKQQELRLVCAANHSVLRRLIQAARRDVQRQEIQRRLAIADADVIEAYNKLESYRPQRKPPLKRDRDAAQKALKERRKILKELEAFDAKSP